MSDRLNVRDDTAYSNIGSQPRGPQHPPATPYRFTPEELRVMRECSRDAFYKRSLPLATLLSILTYGAVKQGYMAGNPRWGPTPKIMAATFIGYFLGKLSYQGICAEKIMRLPNSPMGEALRKRKYGKSGESLTLDPGAVLSPFGSYPAQVYSDITPTHEIDTDRPHIEGLDDYGRPSYDSNIFEEEELPVGTPLHSTTYEELRRKNREEYEQKRSKPQYRGPISDDVAPRPPPSARTPPEYSKHDEHKNVYGDVWEK